MSFAADLEASQYVGQFAIEKVGMVVHVAGVPADPDGDVIVKMKPLDDSSTLFTRTADHPAIGIFETELQSTDTQVPGIFKTEWTYKLATKDQIFVGLVEVGASAPSYDSLAPEMQGIVDATWTRFADMFDSPYGGPHLQVYFQAHFTRQRMGQLLRLGMGTLNTIAQPYSSFSVEPGVGTAFPVDQWGPLLEKSLYIETIKHLIRSYVEQPDAVNITLSRLDRRDYYTRWSEILASEEDDLKKQLGTFKMSMMGLGRVRVLVSGGVYGSYGPTRLAHSAAARPRYWYQFY